jgi:hypothetical protein
MIIIDFISKCGILEKGVIMSKFKPNDIVRFNSTYYIRILQKHRSETYESDLRIFKIPNKNICKTFKCVLCHDTDCILYETIPEINKLGIQIDTEVYISECLLERSQNEESN